MLLPLFEYTCATELGRLAVINTCSAMADGEDSDTCFHAQSPC